MAAQPEQLLPMPQPISPATSEPISWETIDPAVLPAIERLLHRHGPATFKIGDQELNFSWANAQPGEHAITVTLASGAHSLQIELDNLGAIDPLMIGEPFELLPPALRSLVVRKTVASLLTSTPRVLAESLQVTDIQWKAALRTDWPIKLGFRLQRGDDGCVTHGRLSVPSAATLAWLDEQLPAQSKAQRANLHLLPIPIRLVLGQTGLTTSAMRKLEAGDIVWVQSARHTRAGINIDCRIGNLSAALAMVRHRQLQIRNVQALTMKLQPQATATATPPKPVAIDSERTARTLEVPVTFDAGELNVPLWQLERLQPGAVLELPQDIGDSTIQLRVGNSLIAHGALVAIGQRLGVRITHVYLEENSSPTT
ncbi:type III secretion system cytoplasmic ring protein SctQ [Steroidobacter sp. S1-65]|uniref:Type III secretion system cytoplasmic ring protein SctQ n=1 Tax=Steroidobacter gossypii TaxID=2805490 RepID=A0ABS1X103_9GAMM|nr:type III secretion system cytoplasmic ring protein SctQ [Steroidobacter gossypii]MBM0106893.1 type III secretion system cytoplasmic ring protein SctQ [Steroidobacter gossypii]